MQPSRTKASFSISRANPAMAGQNSEQLLLFRLSKTQQEQQLFDLLITGTKAMAHDGIHCFGQSERSLPARAEARGLHL